MPVVGSICNAGNSIISTPRDLFIFNTFSGLQNQKPAEKWLKDRKGRQLTFDDIRHYQKIIVALTETGRLMKEVDGVGIE